MKELLQIRTDRVTLRRFCLDDLSAFQAYRRDPELAKYQGWQPTSDDKARSFLAEQSDQVLGPEGQWLQVAVTCTLSKRLIGDIGLCVSDAEHSVAMIGFTISRDYQRQGYATEAIRVLLTRLLDIGDEIQTVVAVTDARNTPSVMLLRRLGFVLTQTEKAVFRGAPCTEHTFEITALMWRET